MGLKETWAAECKKAYDAKDWDKLWNIMYAGAVGAIFQGKSMASFMLKNYLLKGPDVKFDYTDFWNAPVFPGNGDSWLKSSPTLQNSIRILDSNAKASVLGEVRAGRQSGLVENSISTRTDGNTDGDIYYAIGKFILHGKYKYKIETEWGGKRYVKIERVYWIKEPYDWTPGAKGGILPHDYPIALEKVGKARVFTYEIIFGEPEFKVYI